MKCKPLCVYYSRWLGLSRPSRLSEARSVIYTKISQNNRRFHKLLEIITDLASLQTSFVQLDRVIQITNRRVNALELIVIPNIEMVIKYIDQELEEQERESKYIAKKVVESKGRGNQEAMEEENEANLKEQQEDDEIVFEEERQQEYFMEDFSEQSDDDLF